MHDLEFDHMHVAPGDEVPVEMLASWIDESYETVAATALPKRKR